MITQERQRHRQRKEILAEMNEYLENGLKILQKSRRLLGDEDPVCIRLSSAIKALVYAQSNVKAFIEKGEIIEEF